MTLIVSPGFFWTLVVLIVLVIAGLWAEVWSLSRDYSKLEHNRDFWEQYTTALLQRIHGPQYTKPRLPREIDV